MPHDKNGSPLKVGDEVRIDAVITQISPGTEYCNLTVETVEPMFPDTSKTTIVLNAKQVVKPTDSPAAPDFGDQDTQVAKAARKGFGRGNG